LRALPPEAVSPRVDNDRHFVISRWRGVKAEAFSLGFNAALCGAVADRPREPKSALCFTTGIGYILT
jgi:hypothetical protein